MVTYAYGAEGKHGANYMQTMAASVASLSGMAVLIQAMTWLGLPEPPVWQLVLYFLCIGMFGVGVGMLYTPILVDRMRLVVPVRLRGGEHPAGADRHPDPQDLDRQARRRHAGRVRRRARPRR